MPDFKSSRIILDYQAFNLRDICLEKGGLTEIPDVEFTDEKILKVRAVAYWGSQYDNPIYLVSNFPTAKEAIYWYKKRALSSFAFDYKHCGILF